MCKLFLSLEYLDAFGSQGKGRPRRGRETWRSRQNTFIKFIVLYGSSSWLPKIIMIVTSMITDHRSWWYFNNNERLWNVVRITKIQYSDIKWTKCCWKTADLLDAGLTKEASICIIKGQHLWSIIQWRAITQGLPVYLVLSLPGIELGKPWNFLRGES